MKTNNNLEEFRKLAIEQECAFDSEQFQHYDQSKTGKTNLIMCFVFLGSLLGASTFIGFLGLLIEDYIFDALWFFGPLFFGLTYFILKRNNNPGKEALATSFFISGFLSVLIALWHINDHGSAVFSTVIGLLTIAISLSSILVFRSKIITFLSTLFIFIAIHALLTINDLAQFISLLFAGLLGGYILLSVYEIRLRFISYRFSEYYNPIRAAFFCYLLFLAILFSSLTLNTLLSPSFYQHYEIIIGAQALAILFTIHYILRSLGIKSILVQITFYILGLGMVWFMYPACVIGLVLGLWAFREKNYTNLTLASITFIWAIGTYYYDLTYSLLDKSYLLMGSGLLFLIVFFGLKKGGKKYENK